MSLTFIFDTETTGLPPRGVPVTNQRAWEQCRIVQIAWECYEGNQLLDQACHIIRPDGFKIPKGASDIHGITTEMALEKGIPWDQVASMLADILPNVKRLVAHNITFDVPVLMAQCVRHGREDIANIIMKKEQVCTMKRGTLPNQRWPKLIDLYERCFQKKPQGTLHTADVDVRCCAEIYFYQEGLAKEFA